MIFESPALAVGVLMSTAIGALLRIILAMANLHDIAKSYWARASALAEHGKIAGWVAIKSLSQPRAPLRCSRLWLQGQGRKRSSSLIARPTLKGSAMEFVRAAEGWRIV